MSLKERGDLAAMAYLKWIGMDVLETDYPSAFGVIPIVAMDDHTLVHVTVKIHVTLKTTSKPPSEATLRKRSRQIRSYKIDKSLKNDVRCDTIDIMVIAEDKALLKHHRNAGGE